MKTSGTTNISRLKTNPGGTEWAEADSVKRDCSAARPNFKKCKCGNLIVLAHGDDECAVCYMKRMGIWEDPIEELKRKYAKPQNV